MSISKHPPTFRWRLLPPFSNSNGQVLGYLRPWIWTSRLLRNVADRWSVDTVIYSSRTDSSLQLMCKTPIDTVIHSTRTDSSLQLMCKTSIDTVIHSTRTDSSLQLMCKTSIYTVIHSTRTDSSLQLMCKTPIATSSMCWGNVVKIYVLACRVLNY